MNNWRKSSYSFANGNCAEVRAWRKSSHSSGGTCTEVGQDGTVVLVRDTEDRGGPWLAFDAETWAAFLARLRSA